MRHYRGDEGRERASLAVTGNPGAKGKRGKAVFSFSIRDAAALRMRRASSESSEWRRAGLGQSVDKLRGADGRLALRARRVVETIVLRSGDRAARLLPRRLRLAAGERFSQRRGLQPSRRRRPYLAGRDDAGTRRPAGHAVQRRQSERHWISPSSRSRSRRTTSKTKSNGRPRRPAIRMSISWCATKNTSTATRRSFRRSTLNSRSGRPAAAMFFCSFMGSIRCSPRRSTARRSSLMISKAPGVPVLFTWASRGQATAYVYDLNSATAARDGLEHTLRLLLRSNAEKVNVLAHSMGNWVTVEAFRQIRISGDLPPANKIGDDRTRRARYRHRCVQIAAAPLRQAAKAFLRRPLPGRSSALSLQNHRGRRHPSGRRQRYRGARGVGGDGHRSDRREGRPTPRTTISSSSSPPSRPNCAAFSPGA